MSQTTPSNELTSPPLRPYRRPPSVVPPPIVFPPTSTVVAYIPGINRVSAATARPHGRFSMFDWLQLTPTVAASRSIVGAWLVTVTSSETEDTVIVPLIVIVELASNLTSSTF